MSSRMGRGNYPSINSSDIKEIKLPLPPNEVQQKIVDELEGYQKIIDGCRQVVENYKPTIDIDPSWEMVELGNIGEIKTGKLNANAAVEDGEFPFFTCSKDIYRINTYAFDGEYILLSGNNASGDFDVKYYNGKFNAYQRTYVIRIVSDEYDYQFVRYVMNQQLNILKKASIGSQTKYLTLPIVKSISVPNIPLDEQKNIIERLNVELNGVDGNLKLMEGFNKKIKDKIGKVWGE
jgi:restriction endonuclease S subunit